MQTLQNEIAKIQQVRKAFEYIADGSAEAAGILIYIKGTYKQWAEVMIWLRKNNIRGEKLAQLFQNESPDGGGYLLGMSYILSRMKGHKSHTVGVKANELT